MNVLFLSISALPHMSKHSISLDLLREFRRNGHNVYVVASLDSNSKEITQISEEEGCKVLRVKIGKNKKANLIIKGITTLMLPKLYIRAINRFFADIKFDLVLYTTPPITHEKTVEYIKKRDGAKSYLLLKDIFPQNAVDLEMMQKEGAKGLLYKYFRFKEKKLYSLSDRIGCMSQANVDYVLIHNPSVKCDKVEICPNSIEVIDMRISLENRKKIRRKYDIPLHKKIFIYGGNLSKPQGIPFLIECLKSQKDNEDVFFLVVGDGTEFEKLNIFVNKEHFSNMRLMKKIPKEEYDPLVAACDVGLIFLDHRFTIPNFPSRLLSYMQAGLPVLACTDASTDIGKVITEGKFGWWCESNDISNFKRILKEICDTDIREQSDNAYSYLLDNYTVRDAYKIIESGIKK